MIPPIETTATRRSARSSSSDSGPSANSAADGAVARRSAEFDDSMKLRAEIMREVDVLNQIAVEMAKRDDALLRKYIEMI